MIIFTLAQVIIEVGVAWSLKSLPGDSTEADIRNKLLLGPPDP
jgi:hypothetical protein